MWDTVWNVKSKALSVTLKLRICEEDTDDSIHVEPQPNIAACFVLDSWKVTFMCNCAATYEISLQVIHVETQSAACTNAWLWKIGRAHASIASFLCKKGKKREEFMMYAAPSQ